MILGIGNVLLASSLAALLAVDAQGKFVVTERADVKLTHLSWWDTASWTRMWILAISGVARPQGPEAEWQRCDGSRGWGVLRVVCRESGQVVEKCNLHAVSAMRVLLLRVVKLICRTLTRSSTHIAVFSRFSVLKRCFFASFLCTWKKIQNVH